MGRTNIAYSFFQKGLLSGKRPIGTLRAIVRRSFRDFGDLSYNYIALISMFCNKGMASYEDLYNVIFTASKAESKSSYYDLLAGLNLGYLESWIGSLVRGKASERYSTRGKFWSVVSLIKDNIRGQLIEFDKSVNIRELGSGPLAERLTPLVMGPMSGYSDEDRREFCELLEGILAMKLRPLVSALKGRVMLSHNYSFVPTEGRTLEEEYIEDSERRSGIYAQGLDF